MIVVDGSYGEGGGSVLRQSLALSIITGKPFKIVDIRKNRGVPGIKKQHLASIMLAKEVCNAKVVGSRLGSCELEFYPDKVKGKNIVFDVSSAGSVVLALQSVFLPCLLSGEKFSFSLKGGTDVPHSPSFRYFKEVFLHFFQGFSDIECYSDKPGFYPYGQGEIFLSLKKKNFVNFKDLFFDDIIMIKGHLRISNSVSSNLLDKINFLFNSLGIKFSLEIEESNNGKGVSFTSWVVSGNNLRCGVSCASFKDFDEKNIDFCFEHIKNILRYKVIDEFLADQILVFNCLHNRDFETVNISDHVVSNSYVCELFLDKKVVFEKNKIIFS